MSHFSVVLLPVVQVRPGRLSFNFMHPHLAQKDLFIMPT